jgi:hypothetical protein
VSNVHEGVPNLRPMGVGRSDLDGGERCGGHCVHVGFMWRDFKRMEKALWVFFVAVAALLIKDVVPAFVSKGRESTAYIHAGERLATDRVAEPTP